LCASFEIVAEPTASTLAVSAAHVLVMDAVNARTIPAGARIDETYWSLPGAYGPGDRFDSEKLAISEGIARKRAQLAAHPGSHIPEGFSVDLQWKWDPNPSSGMDMVASRHIYKALVGAEEHLARLVKFGGDQ
jgi:hypothetical protein